jgi:predicted nucleic acid-binding Zn ribbon protein
MPLYTYRREDGTTFEIRQKFLDDPLTVDPVTGQSVVRVVQAAGIIFKGSGFYVNDSKSKSSSTLNGSSSKSDSAAKSETTSETKSEAKTESKNESKPTTSTTAAAD